MNLEEKRKKVELSRVRVVKQELELKIEEKLEEIERLKKHIEIQEQAEEKLVEQLKLMSDK